MIKEIDDAILTSLRNGLSGLIPPDSVIPGEPEPKKKNMVFVDTADFIIEDVCMGTLRQDIKEEFEETFDGDGKEVKFKLSRAPVNQLLFVEYPKGTARNAPDDYAADLEGGIVEFRDPPPKGKSIIRIRYDLPGPVGEKSFLKFLLTYNIAIVAGNNEDRGRLTLASIEALYRDMPMLVKHGVEDMKLVKGYTAAVDGDKTVRQSTLVYNVQTTVEIKTKMAPIEKIEIKKK
jgi:hypothetical protein